MLLTLLYIWSLRFAIRAVGQCCMEYSRRRSEYIVDVQNNGSLDNQEEVNGKILDDERKEKRK